VPGALELLPVNPVTAAVLIQVMKAASAEGSVLIFSMVRPVAENRTSVVRLHLPDRPAVGTYLEVADGVPPAVDLIAS
jgi:hypothetical protein